MAVQGPFDFTIRHRKYLSTFIGNSILQLIHNTILKQRQCLIAFLCLGITLTSSASRREELERAAELAVEKAAERAAERAVEKILDGGNTTTESKLIRESYSNVRKETPRKEKQEDEEYSDTGEYAPVDDDEVEPEEDAEDWSTYIRGSRFNSQRLSGGGFRGWSSKLDFSDIWKRFPRSEWSHEDTSPDKPNENVVTVKKRVPVPVTVEKKIPYSVYRHVPYEIKVPVPHPYTVEKRIPVKIYVNVPVEMPEPYQIERQVPYEVKIDNPVPYKIPMLRPYIVEKRIPEVKVPQSYTVDKPVPYEVKVPIKVPALYSAERKVPVKVTVDRPYPVPVPKPYPIKIKKPHPVPMERPVPVPVKVPDPQSYTVEKPVPVEVVKPYSVPVRVPVDKSYEVYQTKPVFVPVKKPIPFVIQVPVPMKLGWKDQSNVTKNKEDPTESESTETKRRRSR
ncbi:titin [Ooceraea biroi]|uniref:titin n=1 Tax=Ooceraea biroi TaxID=2015173 RepID=UPI000F08BDC1|nr:titin [Ooceraea biroi]